MKYKWIEYKKTQENVIRQILINRGIKQNEIKSFLSPNFEDDIIDPFKLHDMQKCVEQIIKAQKNNHKIGIFADYDADGIPGAAILAKILEILRIEYEVYIPKRTEGYGLNKKGIDYLKEKNVKLIITVDLGITGKKEVEYAQKNNIGVIITDHHKIQDELYPKSANAIVHTAISKNYENKMLCGAAVAYKIAMALMKKYSKISISQVKWMLDLVAISTVCDMEPLIGENRTIVKYGLIVLKKTKNTGLNKLYEEADINKENISTYTIGYQIGPRINALGRMKHAKSAFDLLTTKDENKATKIAHEINQINKLRQNSLDSAVKEAVKKIEKYKLYKNKIIFVKSDNWQIGVVGLIASRLLEKYHRPCIAFTKEGDIYRGSARSIDEFNILSALKKVEKMLVSLGGHEKACGISINAKKYDKVYDKMIKIAQKEINNNDLLKKIRIDYTLDAKSISKKLVKKIEKLEPFGLGNPKPIFKTEKLEIIDIRNVGKNNNHIKMKLKPINSSKIIDAIYFNGISDNMLKRGVVANVVYNLEENNWRGKSYLQLNVIDYE